MVLLPSHRLLFTQPKFWQEDYVMKSMIAGSIVALMLAVPAMAMPLAPLNAVGQSDSMVVQANGGYSMGGSHGRHRGWSPGRHNGWGLSHHHHHRY